MKSLNELCCFYISLLQSISILHRNNHWTVRGTGAYGNHLMFDRLYKNVSENIDLIAEKFVGVFNSEILNIAMQAEIIEKKLGEYAKIHDPVESSLKAEQEFLQFSDHFFKKLKEENKLSLGLDDLLMSISNASENNIYLLKQSLSSQAFTALDAGVLARTNFLRKLIKTA